TDHYRVAYLLVRYRQPRSKHHNFTTGIQVKVMLNKARMAALSLVALLATAPAQAASVSYYLDQSDVLPDGTNWLQVTISDGIDGAVDFTVQILQPLKDLIANCDIGITKFAFNVVEGVNSPLSAL